MTTFARHLGLGRQGSRILEGLFSSSNVSFNLGVFVSLALSLAGTIAVSRSVQVIYEGTFEQTHARGARICSAASYGLQPWRGCSSSTARSVDPYVAGQEVR